MNYEIKTSLFQDMNETFQSLFGARLKEERKALGLNQDQAAQLVGVTREHWGRCERGLAVLGGEVLAALVPQGVDVLYILTGQRSQPVPATAELPAGDRKLLEDFHSAPAQVQAGIKITLGAFETSGSARRGKAA
ncbi:helix-turn-helix transcriptional regulator [Acidovorax sp. BLS4]|uniref:helix-turn-helix domain-containing protein n=1 Tax=Acidovorax sp. BLS4 TaxID=3273430 RepID=UPI002942C760|nr:helix-turn-helix transcriptional regulator [Paracidovorax avenae]WOI46992.1 helix-turn-helix transcriptional regulator [Paracidovorax avenae]